MSDDAPLMLASFPRAVVHIDGDAFFTSVEQALHPALRGRPVVTGKERGIIACASYEAKAKGIKRGVSLWDAMRKCPDLVVLPSDYETYSLFSKRMFEIMRRFTPEVEEYSIDEAFADLTGMRQLFRASYLNIVREMQQTIQRELDITVSAGLSLSKSLAKIASDFRKPNGLTPVAGHHIHLFLPRVPISDIWGLGPNRAELLRKYGITTAWDYVRQPSEWIHRLLHKPGLEIWRELRGEPVLPICTDVAHPETGISKSKTFSSPSSDTDFVYAKLFRNLESAFIKLRRHRLSTSEITISLRRKDYKESAICARLNRPLDVAQDASGILRQLFKQVYQAGSVYRATTVLLGRLKENRSRQYELFEDTARIERSHRLGAVLESVNGKHGKHRVCAGTGLYLARTPPSERDERCWRKSHLLCGETDRKRIRIPRLDLKV